MTFILHILITSFKLYMQFLIHYPRINTLGFNTYIDNETNHFWQISEQIYKKGFIFKKVSGNGKH